MPKSQANIRHLDVDTLEQREREKERGGGQRGEHPAPSSSHVQTESYRKTRTKS